MKISCLIAAYRADATIVKALESIAAQTHPDWEIVVVEDGSRDRTEALVQEFSRRVAHPVRYDNLGVNRGVATARSRLLELAQGDAVAFLDADDWWTPNHLARIAEKYSEGADFVVTRLRLFDLDRQTPGETFFPPPELFRDPARTLFERSVIMTSSSVALRRDLTRRSGDFDPAFRIGEDRDYWLRCAELGARFAGSDETTCFYSKHAGSTMAKTLLWSEQEVAFYRKHFGFSGVSKKRRRELLAHALSNYGRLLRGTDRQKSRRVLGEALRLHLKFATFAHWLISSKPGNG